MLPGVNASWIISPAGSSASSLFSRLLPLKSVAFVVLEVFEDEFAGSLSCVISLGRLLEFG